MDGFERDGFVSIWAFLREEDPADADKDVLQDLCGVDCYDLDSQEGAISDSPQPLSSLVEQLSYSASFSKSALEAADRIGIKTAFGVIAQFDFAYEPSTVTKPISKDPVFIGSFRWHE